MWKTINLDKIDELHKEFHSLRLERETFSKFIERTADDEIPVWDWIDSIGVVTPQDFEETFDKDFIEENFKELAHDWFNGLQGQIDFGILLDCIKEDWDDRYEEWKEK